MSEVVEHEEVQQDNFVRDLYSFMKHRGTPLPPPPMLGGKPFDLWGLYKLVTDRGGLENVLKEKLWGTIVQFIDLPECPNPAYTLRVLYLKYLYAYERRNFLYIDDDEGSFDYSPKLRGATNGVATTKPSAPLSRPMLKHDYRRTPLPAESTRLHTLQLQKICFALRSGNLASIQWGLEVLAIKSFQGEVALRGNVVGGGDDGPVVNLGSSLLSALSDLAKGYYSPIPDPLWKSEKAPDSPNEAHILSILRNLTLVPQNDVEMAQHTGCLDFLILSLSHPSPTCVEDALETLASISYHIILGWEGGRFAINTETSRELVLKISNLLGEEFPSTLLVIANLTGQTNNWPHLENIFSDAPNFYDRLDSVLNSGEEDISTHALKIVYNISKHGTKAKEKMANTKGIMMYLVRFLAVSRGEEEMEEENVVWVIDTLYNLGSDPLTKSSLLLYEHDLLHVVLLETAATDAATTILSTLATL